MKRVIKIQVKGSHNWCVVDASVENQSLQHEINELIQGGEVGDWVKLTLADMDEEKFNNLKEFTGW